MADISQRLLGAGALAKNDWAKAEAATSLTFTGEAQIRRGIEIAIGLSALATADAGLSRFIDATVRGNAFAEATANLRYQLPLNLFDAFGVTIGAQAVAQAAAGIEVGLGLSIGDFIALIHQNSESEGLPIDLVLLLLDEATVGGKFEVHVAAAAMAYASVLITGEVVKDPGFHVTVDAGLGLAAGVGFSGGLDLGIRDFRKFYGRAVDRTINSVVDGVGALLPSDLILLMPRVQALAPVAATALRVAYEVGDYLARNQPGPDHKAALDLSNHCVGVILEEAQRFLFGRFLEAGLRSLQNLVTRDVPDMATGVWDGLMPQRRALAAVLYRTPDEPFQPTAENAAYWSDLIAKATDLVAQLSASTGDDVTRGMAMVFSTAELLTEVIRSRINVAQSYAFAVGAGGVTSPPPKFDSPLATQPGPRIRDHINGVLGRATSQAIDYPDLVVYLAKDAIIVTLRQTLPAVDEYLAIFQDPKIAGSLNDVVRILLQNREAFLRGPDGDFDPQETLRVLLGVLDAFISDKINRDLVPALNQRIADDNIKLYFNEVLMGTLLYTKNVAFQTVLDWEKHPVDRSAFTEALAAVMTMLLGRSLVLVGEGFMAALQADMQRACAHAASQMDSAKNPFTEMGIAPSPELKALLADTLRVGGEVFGPLPDDTRRSLRFVLYDVMETLPPTTAEQTDLLGNLADQFFIPNQQSMRNLSDQLLSISRERFQLFVQRVLELGGRLLGDAIENFINQVIKIVLGWVADLEGAIKTLVEAIGQLEQLIQGLIGQAQQALEQATQKLEGLLEQFSNQSLRSRLRTDITNEFVKDANTILADIPLYWSLPQAAKTFVKEVLATVIGDVIGGPVLNPILDAIGAITGELDSMLDDVRELNPNQPLAPQLLDLVLDRIEDRVRDAFGGSKPSIDAGFAVTILGFSQHFPLGRIELPFDRLFTILRAAVAALTFYESELETAAAALATAFSKSLDLQAKQDERADKKTDHDRLSRIRGEFTSAPKTITIVNPVQSLVYDDDIDMRIRLGNVPSSYLGLNKDEQQRVLIFLNGGLIAPQALAVGDPFVSLDSGKLQDPINISGLAGFDPAAAAIIGSAARIDLWQPDTSGAAQSAPLDNTLPLQSSLRSLAAGRYNTSSRPIIQQTVRQSDAGTSVVTSALNNVLPGRRMTATKRAALEQTLPPGTTVQFRADLVNLVIGTNTLAVVVIDPGGQRYQQVVSFGVAVVSAVPSEGAKLPAPPWRKPSGNAASPPASIDLHFNNSVIADRLKKAQTFLTEHSSLHLQEFRRH